MCWSTSRERDRLSSRWWSIGVLCSALIFARDKSHLDDGVRYYRFNVDRRLEEVGLEESRKKEIAAATRRYVESQVVLKQMKACANDIAGREC